MTISTDQNLDPSAGFYLRGVAVDQRTFMATVTFRQLRAITRDPAVLQASTTARGQADPELQAERDLHDLVQRAIMGNKKSNVPRYADYIAGISRGRSGVLPPIHLWSQPHLDSYQVQAGTFLQVSLGDTLLAIDGETQLTAHWRLSRTLTDKDEKEAHSKMPLSVVVHHGISTETARQYFHDLNILAVRPNIGVGLAMDTTDPIMQIMGNLEALDVLVGKVDRQARQLGKRSEKIVTLSSLRQMVINIAHGMSGIQYGSRPAPMSREQVTRLHELAPVVVEAYFRTFERQIADREHYLAGTAPVLAAVGAMAQQFMELPATQQAAQVGNLMSELEHVDWTRSAKWRGVAGDFTSRGVFSVKGTKEVSYAVFNALTDTLSPAYDRIRRFGDDDPVAPSTS